jgi:hypothetical protein
VERRSEAGRRLQLFAWAGDHVESLFDTAAFPPDVESRLFHPGVGLDPTGELLLFRDLASSLGDFDFWLFDTVACRRGDCEFQRLPGRPIWSPDGRRTVLVSDVAGADSAQSVGLFLADRWGARAVPLGEGYAPFWLAADTLGYFQRRPVPTLFTVRLAAGNEEAPVLLTRSYTISPGNVRQVAVHPADPERLFLLLEARQRMVVSFHLGSGEWLMYQPAAALHESDLHNQPAGSLHGDVSRCPDQNCWRTESFSLSPDGRWLATVNGHFLDSRNSSWVTFHDLAQALPARLLEAQVPVAVAAASGGNWSHDGRWLLLPKPGALRLYAPAEDAFDYYPLAEGCLFAGWLGAEP